MHLWGLPYLNYSPTLSLPSPPQVTSILKYLFPVPKEDSKRVVTFANQDDYISFRWVQLWGAAGNGQV